MGCVFNPKGANLTITIQKTIVSLNFCVSTHEKGTIPTRKTIAVFFKLYQFDYAIWWYDMPQVWYSFFDAYDFSGKTIIPFNVHNGSRFSDTIDTIKELEPDAIVFEDGFTVSEQSVADAAGDVDEWLNGLGS